MDYMIKRDPITGLFERHPIPGEEEHQEEVVPEPEFVIDLPTIFEAPKKRGRPPK